jgi:hypothetical protein
VSGVNNCDQWKSEKFHTEIDARKLLLIVIMTTADALTTLPVWDLENVRRLNFIPHNVPGSHVIAVTLKYYRAREFLFLESQ